MDDFGGERDEDEQVEGAESTLAPAPLLANLGKASANGYWMDMTVRMAWFCTILLGLIRCLVDASDFQRPGTVSPRGSRPL